MTTWGQPPSAVLAEQGSAVHVAMDVTLNVDLAFRYGVSCQS